MQNNKKINLTSRAARGFSAIVLVLSLFSVGCQTIEKLNEPKPLEGPNVSVYPLGDGQVDLRLKVSTLTSTLWVTTELVNNSTEPVVFETPKLLQFQDPSCLENQEFEKPRVETLAPNERQIVRYSFQLYSQQKRSPAYERCRDQALKFTVSGVQVAGKELPMKTLTIVSE